MKYISGDVYNIKKPIFKYRLLMGYKNYKNCMELKKWSISCERLAKR